jgi:small subunit ribosomal protein S7e
MAFTARTKILKGKGATITEYEKVVAQHIYDLQHNADAKLKASLAPLFITSAKEIDVGGKRVAVVFFPIRQQRAFQRVQPRIVDELEKKLGKVVVCIAQRRILKQPTQANRRKMQKVPRSRTLTAVHDAILEDLVYPAEVTDKRIRVRIDNTRVFKVLLSAKHEPELEGKLEVYSKVYKRLTGKNCTFAFPAASKDL